MSSNIGIIKYIIINQSLFEYETMKSGGVVTNSMTDCPLSHLRTPERNLFGVHHLVSAALANRSKTSELATSPTWVALLPSFAWEDILFDDIRRIVTSGSRFGSSIPWMFPSNSVESPSPSNSVVLQLQITLPEIQSHSHCCNIK